MRYHVIKQCQNCHRPYGFISGGGGPIQDREHYFCPYCKEEQGTEKTGGIPDTVPLTEEEQAAWRASKK